MVQPIKTRSNAKNGQLVNTKSDEDDDEDDDDDNTFKDGKLVTAPTTSNSFSSFLPPLSDHTYSMSENGGKPSRPSRSTHRRLTTLGDAFNANCHVEDHRSPFSSASKDFVRSVVVTAPGSRTQYSIPNSSASFTPSTPAPSAPPRRPHPKDDDAFLRQNNSTLPAKAPLQHRSA
ncbi:uncharacterized protein LOC117181068 [Belonocnema kinseyi]|uniref:uncharacterized protein LOC117181068 n=1 Tax=Belonocnema kinseyi TaxID=2817044 RepID=UPI00143E040F|nr:uncharacterized protein LOC117181068 [Belonocnema kinseyi]